MNIKGFTVMSATAMLACAFASSANAAQCQSALNDLLAMDSYADATCSGDLSNANVARACSAALDLVEVRLSEYEQCMALDSGGPI